MSSVVVLAPVAFIKRDGGGEPLQVEQGQPVPDEADGEHVGQLTQLGVIGADPLSDTSETAAPVAPVAPVAAAPRPSKGSGGSIS